MSSNVGQGGTITLDAVFTDGTGSAVAPVGPTVEVLDPAGTQVVAPVTPDRNPSTGRYEYDFTAAVDAPIGAWTARWVGTINGVVVADDDTFTVAAAGDVDFTGSTDLLASVDQFAAVTGQTITAGSAEESRAVLLLGMASGEVRDYLRQTVSRVVGNVQTLRGVWGDVLTLPERPVASVASVTVEGLAVTGYELLAGGRLRRVGSWGGPDTLVQVTYTHGWSTPPAGIAGKVAMLAARLATAAPGIHSETIGDYSIRFSTEHAGALTDAERSSLDRYRRRSA